MLLATVPLVAGLFAAPVAATDAAAGTATSDLNALELQLLQVDAECERAALTDCATYDPNGYDPNWPSFEDAATGVDFVDSSPVEAAPWTYQGIVNMTKIPPDTSGDSAAGNWTCSGYTGNPRTYQASSGRFLTGTAEQFCSGSGWQPQRVITAIQWKHTQRFQRDHWDTVSQTVGPLTYTQTARTGTTAKCPGSRSRTYRTVGVGYAQNDRYGGPNGGGLEYSQKELALGCDLTKSH